MAVVCGAGFPASARLLARSAFDRVYRAGHSAGSTFFRGLILSSPTGAARLGITVPKRCVAKAHARNRIKRLLREDFRVRRQGLPAVDLVIQARGAVALADAAALRQDLERLFKRLLALPPPPARGSAGASHRPNLHAAVEPHPATCESESPGPWPLPQAAPNTGEGAQPEPDTDRT